MALKEKEKKTVEPKNPVGRPKKGQKLLYPTDKEKRAQKYACAPKRADGKPKHFRVRRTKSEIKHAERFKNRRTVQKKTKQMEKLLGITTKAENKINLFRMSNYITIGKIEKALKAIREPKQGIVIHEYLLKAFGSLDITAVFSFLYYLEGQLLDPKDNGFFVSTYKMISQYTGVKAGRVGAITKEFRASGLIETKLLGVPAKQHYQIDHLVLMELLYEANLPKGFNDPLNGTSTKVLPKTKKYA